MGLSRRHAVNRWRLSKSAFYLLVAGAATGLGMIAAAVTVRMVRIVLTPEKFRPEEVQIIAVDRRAGLVVLSVHPQSILPGRYSLYFDHDRGYAQVGAIVAITPTTVTRLLLAERRGSVRGGVTARLGAWFYENPADLAVPLCEVNVDTAVGPAPAWVVPYGGSTGALETDGGQDWAIHVHGRGVDRRESIRAIPAFRASGFTSLLISYRNDGVAPASVDGQYSLGDVEWNDVDSAIDFAIKHGAKRIVLMGWSMGGALVLQTLSRSSHAGYICGLVLDSPVIDWVRVLEHQAGTMNVPRPIRSLAYQLISRPWGKRITGQAEPIDLRRLDFIERAAELTVPILLMHSESDSYVPSSGSAMLARLRPDIVTYVSFDGPGHTRLWNYNEEKWSRALIDWLSRLPQVRTN